MFYIVYIEIFLSILFFIFDELKEVILTKLFSANECKQVLKYENERFASPSDSIV